jgi:hypothetical protein
VPHHALAHSCPGHTGTLIIGSFPPHRTHTYTNHRLIHASSHTDTNHRHILAIHTSAHSCHRHTDTRIMGSFTPHRAHMEGTSEASLAASAPRVAQMLYQPKNRAQDVAGRTADCKVGAGTAAATKGSLKLQSTSETHLARRAADCKVGAGTAAATKGCGTGQVRLFEVQFSLRFSVAIIHTTQLPLLFISGLGFGPRFRASGFALHLWAATSDKYPMVRATRVAQLHTTVQTAAIRITQQLQVKIIFYCECNTKPRYLRRKPWWSTTWSEARNRGPK